MLTGLEIVLMKQRQACKARYGLDDGPLRRAESGNTFALNSQDYHARTEPDDGMVVGFVLEASMVSRPSNIPLGPLPAKGKNTAAWQSSLKG